MAEMSFSQQVKQEICAKPLRSPCCIAAACYSIACFCKYFDTRGIVLHTEQKIVAQWAKSMFASSNIKGQIFVKGSEENPIYEFSIKDPFEVEKMLVMFGHSGEETSLRVNPNNFECENCFSSFISAAFLCCGTMIKPEKGYSLEFVISRYGMSQDLEELLCEKGFPPKRTVRKGINILYYKSSEKIEDILTYMRANKSAMEIMNLKIYKDFRNKANRITNCETANIDKTLEAAKRFFIDVSFLEENGVLDLLDAPLLDAIDVRKEHPELSLAELAEKMPEPVSKSGLSHRYRKISAKADALRQKQA